MRSPHRALLALIGALLVAVVACGSISDPPKIQRVPSPLAGTWELTTHLDAFSFETSAPSPPDCPENSMYCTHLRTTTAGAYLGGAVDIRDTSSAADSIARTLLVTGVLQVSFCNSIDYAGLTGCTSVSDRAAIQYAGSIGKSDYGDTPESLSFVIGEPDDGSGRHREVRSLNLRYAGDSIYGPIYWGASAGRSPPSYRGTIVLHRVR